MQFPAPLRPRPLRWRTFRTISALILREMTTSYGRSPGGYLWAILEPVGAIAVMSVLFSFVLRSPGLGTNFPLFYATGYLVFGLYTGQSAVASAAISYSRALLSYPAVTFMDALLARLLLNLLTQLLVMVIVLGGIVTVYGLNPVIDWSAAGLAVAIAVALGIGVGTVNCFLFSLFPAWRSIWAIVNRPMFLLSGILFIPEMMPGALRDWIMFNPLIHATALMRRAFYPTYEAVRVVPLYPFAVAIVLTIFGILFLRRYHKDLVNR